MPAQALRERPGSGWLSACSIFDHEANLHCRRRCHARPAVHVRTHLGARGRARASDRAPGPRQPGAPPATFRAVLGFASRHRSHGRTAVRVRRSSRRPHRRDGRRVRAADRRRDRAAREEHAGDALHPVREPEHARATAQGAHRRDSDRRARARLRQAHARAAARHPRDARPVALEGAAPGNDRPAGTLRCDICARCAP